MQLRLYRLDIPFTTAFAHSTAVRTATESVWVEAQSGQVTGVGEGCPRAYVTGEDVPSARRFFDDHRRELGRDVTSIDALQSWVEDHAPLIDANPAAWCACELAILDLLAKQASLPVEPLVATAPVAGQFRYSAVVGDGDPDMFRATVARYRALGFEDFKLKLSGDPGRDRDKIAAMRALEDFETLRIRVDANNLWETPAAAVHDLTSLGCPLLGIEEPLPANALDDMRIVSDQTGWPIILDESFLRAEQMALIADDPQHWIINVRVSKMGGVLRSMRLVDDARKTGIPIIVGAQVGETSVLTRAGLTIARAAGPALLAQEGAFGTHLLTDDVATPPLVFGRAGMLDADARHLSTQAGWGLTLNPERDFAVLLSG